MKLDNESLQDIVRKRSQKAGEVIRPTRRVRRRVQGESAQAFGESEPAPAPRAAAEAAPAGATAQAEGPREEAPVEVQADRGAPQRTVPVVVDLSGEPSDETSVDGPIDGGAPVGAIPTGGKEGGPVAQVEENSERVLTVFSSVGPGAEGAVPAPSEPAGEGEGEAAAGEPTTGAEGSAAHPEPVENVEGETAAGEPIVGVEGLVAPPAGEEGGEELTGEGEESPDPPTSGNQATTRYVVEKTATGPSGLPRPAPRFSMMEDARQAERLLERLCLPIFRQ